MGIDVDGDTADDCSTKAGGNSKCSLAQGSTFTLRAYLNSLGPATGYEGFQVVLHYSGVASKDNASTDAWPDCVFDVSYFETGLVAAGCTVGINAPPSTFTGLVATNDFTCAANGNITMIHGPLDTLIVESEGTWHLDPDVTETLTINCSAASGRAHRARR